MRKRLLPFLALFCMTATSVAAQDDVFVDTASVSVGTGGSRQESFSVLTQAPPVDVRQLPQEKVEALKRSEDYWYANLEPEKKEPAKTPSQKRSKSLFEQPWFQNLLWMIILCSFVGVVIWYLAASNVSLFRRQARTLAGDTDTLETTDDIFGIAYDREIAKAEASQNFRLALRLWYLKTLKALSDRTLIDYRPERPNGHYVMSLFGSRHYSAFFRLTRTFEYTWYGQFPLSAEAYQAVKIDFQTFQNSVSA